MKDFYDIYYLASSFDFEGERLRFALAETLRNRKTDFDSDSFERVLNLVDDGDIQVRWRYFQKTINQTGLSLSDVMHLIDEFLHPVFKGVLTGDILEKRWNAKERKWGS